MKQRDKLRQIVAANPIIATTKFQSDVDRWNAAMQEAESKGMKVGSKEMAEFIKQRMAS